MTCASKGRERREPDAVHRYQRSCMRGCRVVSASESPAETRLLLHHTSHANVIGSFSIAAAGCRMPSSKPVLSSSSPLAMHCVLVAVLSVLHKGRDCIAAEVHVHYFLAARCGQVVASVHCSQACDSRNCTCSSHSQTSHNILAE